MNAVAAAVILLSSAPALGPDALPKGWEALTFRKIERRTEYRWSVEERALHAQSRASASGLIRRLDLDASAAPVLRWRWKVAGTLPEGDARKKSGDDYAARVYVTFRYDPEKASPGMHFMYSVAKRLHGEYPPHAGINYIWANRLPKGASVPSPYTDRSVMVAVRSGDGEAGRWMTEERDILEDYRRLFGQEPPPLAGIAVMTDSDNTGGTADAWYADIALYPRKER